jgi:hypothetical protein
VWWLKLGIVPERIEPGKPQQNGKHERMHRTLKAEAARPPAANQRRHEALGQQPPQTVYEPAERSYPRKLEDPEYPGHWERRRVRKDGYVKFRGSKRFLGEALAGELTGWVETDKDIWQIWFGPAELAIFDASAGAIWSLGKTVRGPRRDL